MNKTCELKKYKSPEIAKIQMDKDISLILASAPTGEPWGSKLIAPQREDPFKTNLA